MVCEMLIVMGVCVAKPNSWENRLRTLFSRLTISGNSWTLSSVVFSHRGRTGVMCAAIHVQRHTANKWNEFPLVNPSCGLWNKLTRGVKRPRLFRLRLLFLFCSCSPVRRRYLSLPCATFSLGAPRLSPCASFNVAPQW